MRKHLVDKGGRLTDGTSTPQPEEVQLHGCHAALLTLFHFESTWVKKAVDDEGWVHIKVVTIAAIMDILNR